MCCFGGICKTLIYLYDTSCFIRSDRKGDYQQAYGTDLFIWHKAQLFQSQHQRCICTTNIKLYKS
ncbi:GTPase Obg [Labeo rohita]|uniref:GTPase Obg n=1 Tax=Labeo rohita TaxID=84645 RepID=A0ABQ8M4P0_LABRO|nr:GTPase Obg [Labeo rohita]